MRTTLLIVLLGLLSPIAAPYAVEGQTPDRQLFEAVSSGTDSTEVSRLLAAGADVNGKHGEDQWTLLHKAAETGNAAVVSLLIAKGAKIDSKTRAGLTALHLAAREGNAEVAQLLLGKNASTREQAGNGRTALHEAIGAGKFTVAKLLLQSRARVDVRDADGDSPLHYAAAQNDPEVIRMLLGSGARLSDRNRLRETALFNAARADNTNNARLLIDAGADVNATNQAKQSPFDIAFAAGHYTMAVLLRNAGAKDSLPFDALDKAIEKGAEISEVKLLLGLGAYPQGLSAAVRSGRGEIVEVLLEAGAKPAADTFLLAVGSGATEIVLAFLAKGTDPDFRPISTRLELEVRGGGFRARETRERNGPTGLVAAIRSGHAALARLLLQKGADPNVLVDVTDPVTDEFDQLLYSHSGLRSLDAGLFLAQVGGGDDLVIKDVGVFFQFGFKSGERIAVIENGAPSRRMVEKFERQGLTTPLILAVQSGNASIVEMLLEFKADSAMMDGKGLTALMHAEQSGHSEIVALLKR